VSVARAAVLACARTYLGTRWLHQGRVKGVGVDCAGLIICVAGELGLARVTFDNYSQYPDGATLQSVCSLHMDQIDLGAAQPGDVMVFTFDRDPQHLGFRSEIDGRPGLIHCYASAKRVVEHDLDELWRTRARSAWRIPGVE
jgi:hypothetical protein